MAETLELEGKMREIFERIKRDCRASGGEVSEKVTEDGTYIVTCTLPESKHFLVTVDSLIFDRVVWMSPITKEPYKPYKFSPEVAEEVTLRADGATHAELANVRMKTAEPSPSLGYEVRGYYKGVRISYNPKEKELRIDLLKY